MYIFAPSTTHIDWRESKNSTFLHSGLSGWYISFSEENEKLVEQNCTLLRENAVLHEQNRALIKKIKEQEVTILELRGRLGLNSKNSSKPPSSDGYAKPKPKSRINAQGKNLAASKGILALIWRFRMSRMKFCNICLKNVRVVLISLPARQMRIFPSQNLGMLLMSLSQPRRQNIRHSSPPVVPATKLIFRHIFQKAWMHTSIMVSLSRYWQDYSSTFGAISFERIHILLNSLMEYKFPLEHLWPWCHGVQKKSHLLWRTLRGYPGWKGLFLKILNN